MMEGTGTIHSLICCGCGGSPKHAASMIFLYMRRHLQRTLILPPIR